MKKLFQHFSNVLVPLSVLVFAQSASAKSDAELIGKFLQEDKSAGIGALFEGMAGGGESVSDQDAVTGLFDSLVGGSKFESIKVEVAEPGRLVLLVKYRNFRNYELITRAVGKNGGSVDSYIPPVIIDPGNKQGRLNVELLMSSSDQYSLKTSHVRFEARPKNGQSGSAWTYKLKKNWGTGTAVVTGSGTVASGGAGTPGGNGQEPPAYPGSYPGQADGYVGRVVPVTLVGHNEETRNLRKSESSTNIVMPKAKVLHTSATITGNRSSRVTVISSKLKTVTFGHLATATMSPSAATQQTSQTPTGVQWMDTTGCVVTKTGNGKTRDCRDGSIATYKNKVGSQYLGSSGCVITKKANGTRRDCRTNAKLAYNLKAKNGPQQVVVVTPPTDNRPKDKTPQGPSDAIIPLLGDAVVSVPSMRPEDIIPFHYNIYQDANPDSGVFYYLPTAYHLKWDTDRGHGLDINLGAQGGSAGNDTVSINATLDSGIGLEDSGVAKKLAEAYIKRNSTGIKLTELRPMIVDTVPTTSLKEDLQVNSIEASNISVNPGTDIFRDMSVAWTSDAVTKANIYQLLRNDNGISSQLTFQVGEGESGAVVTVPTDIALASSETFGQISFDRSKDWTNETPYPVKLKYVHALILENRIPVVYSWELGDAVLQPRIACSGMPAMYRDGLTRRP